MILVNVIEGICETACLKLHINELPHVGLGYPLSAFALPLSIHFLIFCSFLLFPFLIYFTYFLLLSIHPFLPESSHSISRPEVLGLVCFVYYCVICIA